GENCLCLSSAIPADVIVGISASGDAPFVVAALEYAQSLGAVAAMITCNQKSKALQFTDHKIFVDVGPEIIAGSTRMKVNCPKTYTEYDFHSFDDSVGKGLQ
ncbi:MAG: SIS domain-containing protein, partial [Sphaerochaetaceae bacterium]|nr:SIS domain-containing protein [Sphaerochaetaceae bacterium]